LEESLAGQGVRVEKMASDKSLVSLVGSPAFIAESFPRAGSVLETLGIETAFREQVEIRGTFAVPNDQSSRLVRALYETFVQ
jgi:hypothetical protein